MSWIRKWIPLLHGASHLEVSVFLKSTVLDWARLPTPELEKNLHLKYRLNKRKQLALPRLDSTRWSIIGEGLYFDSGLFLLPSSVCLVLHHLISFVLSSNPGSFHPSHIYVNFSPPLPLLQCHSVSQTHTTVVFFYSHPYPPFFSFHYVWSISHHISTSLPVSSFPSLPLCLSINRGPICSHTSRTSFQFISWDKS